MEDVMSVQKDLSVKMKQQDIDDIVNKLAEQIKDVEQIGENVFYNINQDKFYYKVGDKLYDYDMVKVAERHRDVYRRDFK